MSEVLTKEHCAVGAELDMVGIKFGPPRLLLYYHTAFEVAHGTCMSAKFAGRYEGVRPQLWREFVRGSDRAPTAKPHYTYRRSGAVSSITDWSVAFDRNLVVWKFDDLTVKMHYSEAFQMYAMIRNAARKAKAWSGDRSRIRTVRAVLTNAEANDKILYTM